MAPDVGILLVSSLSLCVCCRLGRATSRRNPESLEASEGVRATPTALGTSHHPHPTGFLPACLGLIPVPSLGTAWGLAWGHPQWSGTQFGAVLARLEGLVIVTQLRVTQPWRSARVCSGIATGIGGKQAGQWGGQLWGAEVLTPSSCAMPAPPGSASRSRGHCACGTGVTQADTPPGAPPGPLWGLPSTPGCRAWLWPCRAVTGAAALDAFAVSPGGSLEKSSVLGTRIPEPRKTAALRSRCPGCADEINTARCRALCPPGRPPLPSPEQGN